MTVAPGDTWRSDLPPITLHVLDASHPAEAAAAALDTRGIEYERVVLLLDGTHPQKVEEIYGEGKQSVPGMLLGDERVHGSNAIFERLDGLIPDEVSLFPEPNADTIREAANWGDDVLQTNARRMIWGSLQLKPYAAAQAIGGEPLNPAASDFMAKLIRAICRHHGITFENAAQGIQDLPGHLDHVDDLIERGVLGQSTDLPNAADLQIGASLSLMQTIGDVRPIIEGRPCAELAKLTTPRAGMVPAGAFPEHWMTTG